MDTITHSLAGALVGHALGSERKKYLLPTNKSMLCGAISAAYPDIDYISSRRPHWSLSPVECNSLADPMDPVSPENASFKVL